VPTTSPVPIPTVDFVDLHESWKDGTFVLSGLTRVAVARLCEEAP
jgi:hypothetical protein